VESLTGNFMEPFVPRHRIKHTDPPEPAPRGRIPNDTWVVDRMLRKLKTKAGKETYLKRKETVEPAFGQIKEVRGIRALLLRGLENVRAEWVLICLTRSILKLWGWFYPEDRRTARFRLK
jgi:hypothetical protein